MKLLVVEDEPTTRMLLQHSIRRWGYDVVAVENGALGWDELRKGDVRLVVCDWEMPVLDGPALCQRVRELCIDFYIYFVLLTHHADSDFLARGLAAGADDYLSKPLNPVELRARLEVGKRLLALHDELLTKNAELDQMNKRLSFLAGTDSLTLLPNRRSFDESMGQLHEVAARRAQPYGILVVDLDHFKSINDRFGHSAGDTALSSMANVLRSATTESDFVFRYGGEEFVVIVGAASEAALLAVAERIRESVAKARIVIGSGEPLRLTTSVGATIYDGSEQVAWTAVLERADAALYTAKRGGRDRVVVASGGRG